MPSHSPPGVHFEEISTRSQPIKGVSTSITAFIGFTPKGIVAEPILISKLEDYTSEFGDIQSETDSMGLAVRAYYLNGGGTAYICRLASEVNSAADYMALYESTLHKYRDISIIVLPDEQMAEDGSGNAAINATLAHCERMESCILIIDPPQGYELNDANAVRHLSLPASPYAVLYYPWVKMANPLNNSDALSGADKNVLISAHGNTLRALCKKLFHISNKNISRLEIPTGNPLLIKFRNNLKIDGCRYLDSGRSKNLLVKF